MVRLWLRGKVMLMRWPHIYLGTRRAFVLVRYVVRRPHDPDFRVFANAPQDGLFLDVGANSGLSALSFRTQNRGMSILSIEANPFHEGDLRFLKKLLRRYDYRIVAAGDRRDRLRLHVPHYGRTPLTGEASVLPVRDEDLDWWAQRHLGRPAHFEYREVEVSTIPLDDLELVPSIVKIDVEGFEHQVLRGLARTLARHRPLVMLERPSPEQLRTIDEMFAGWGYQPRRADETGRLVERDDVHSVNVFYLPQGEDRGVGLTGGPQPR